MGLPSIHKAYMNYMNEGLIKGTLRRTLKGDFGGACDFVSNRLGLHGGPGLSFTIRKDEAPKGPKQEP